MRVRLIENGVWMIYAAILLVVGCRDANRTPPEGAPPEPPGFRQDPEALAMVRISRPTRSASEVADRAADVVQALTGSAVSPSEAIGWAQQAVAERHKGAGALPFSTAPDVSVHYIPYTDMLVARDQSITSGLVELVAEGTQSGNPDPGIGKRDAIDEAELVFAALTSAGLVDSSWSMADSHRVQQGFVSAGVPHRWVRDYILEYRRHIEDVPLLDTSASITVHRTGEVAEIALADMDTLIRGYASQTLNEPDAADEFRTEAEAAVDHFDPVPSTIIKWPRVAYVIPEADESGTRGPEYFAGILYQHQQFLEPMQLGVVALTGSDHSLRILEMYQGDPLPAAADGTPCGAHADCTSGHCYIFDGYYGICGPCSSDSDCSSGGCNPPDPITRPPVPSSCGSGALGDGCESGASCGSGLQCATVADAELGYELKACSACSSDSNCSFGGFLCEPVLEISPYHPSARHHAYRTCVPPGSVELGAVCTRDAACASGHCVELVFSEGSTVGVCSECLDDTQCSGSESCVGPTFSLGTGFAAGQCST